jgi:transcriptional regulator NrdR family protein
MPKEIMVIKRGGSKELFDPEKISRVVAAAGLRPVEAAELAEGVARWIELTGKEEVSSIEIRDRVFKELEKVDKYASGLYAWYQNLKDKKYRQSAND